METDRSQQEASSAQALSAQRARYFVLILTVIYASNYLDRNLFNILLDPIAREFGASDTVMGLLAGFAFVAFQSLLSLPLTYLGGGVKRRSILALGALLWGGMTILCGAAHSIGQLLLARIGLGVAEASGALVPSVISDLFPRDERARVVGFYSIGLYVGIFLGYLVGGWACEIYGWRTALVIAGIPGIVMAIVLRFTVTEPARPKPGDARARRVAPAPLLQSMSFFTSQKSFMWGLAGYCTTMFANFGLAVWVPTFMIRVHHLAPGEVGTYVGAIRGFGVMAGVLAGGIIIEHLVSLDRRWTLRAPAVAAGIAGPALLFFLLVNSVYVALVGLTLAVFLAGFQMGPVFAFGQTVVRKDMRRYATGIYTLVSSFIGLGLGSLVIGLLNDGLNPIYGEEAIRYSLIVAALASSAGGAIWWHASSFVAEDIRRAGDRRHEQVVATVLVERRVGPRRKSEM